MDRRPVRSQEATTVVSDKAIAHPSRSDDAAATTPHLLVTQLRFARSEFVGDMSTATYRREADHG